MSFVLLGKTAEDRLYLVSEIAFETRGEALQELSRITGSAEFAGWDDEIFVIDDRRGAPVVLVRSAEETPSATADESRQELRAEASEPQPAAEEPAEEEQLAEEPTAGVDEPLVVDEPSGDAAPAAEEVAVAVEPTAGDERSDEEASAGEPSDDRSDEMLKEALLRSADRMEAEGIVVPESVGSEVPEQPVDEDAVPVETPEGDSAVGAWPWDSDEDGTRLDLDGFEESGDDNASLVRAAGDDETLSIARPVIMGAYADAAGSEPERAPEREPEPEAGAVAADVERIGRSAPEPVEVAETERNEFVELPSDYVDLGSLPESDIQPVAPGAGIDAMTCDDCVYVDTCPNKGQSEPSSCGSFQWK